MSYLPAHPSAVNSEHLTADISARPTGEVYHAALEVVRTAPPTRRNTRQDAFRTLLVVDQRRIHFRRDVTRRNGIDTNALGCPLVAKRLGQLRNTALARRVRRNGQAALEAQQRRNVDD